jgi:hypothetical protein
MLLLLVVVPVVVVLVFCCLFFLFLRQIEYSVWRTQYCVVVAAVLIVVFLYLHPTQTREGGLLVLVGSGTGRCKEGMSLLHLVLQSNASDGHHQEGERVRPSLLSLCGC